MCKREERERDTHKCMRVSVWVIVRACGYVNELASIGGLMSIRAAAYLDSNCQISLFYNSVLNGRCKNASSQYFLLSVGVQIFFPIFTFEQKIVAEHELNLPSALSSVMFFLLSSIK